MMAKKGNGVQESSRRGEGFSADERGSAGIPQNPLWLGSAQAGDLLDNLCYCRPGELPALLGSVPVVLLNPGLSDALYCTS